MADRLDVLLKMYDEHASHAKLHEEQREKMTNYLFLATGLIVTFITSAKFAYYTIPASIVLIALGVYGALFSMKHYERNRHHTEILRQFRRELDREVTPDKSGKGKRSLSEITRTGREDHFKSFYISKKRKSSGDDPRKVAEPGAPDASPGAEVDVEVAADDDHPGLVSADERWDEDLIGQFVLNSRLYRYWAALPLLSAVIGVIFLGLALGGYATDGPAKPFEVRLVQPVEAR